MDATRYLLMQLSKCLRSRRGYGDATGKRFISLEPEFVNEILKGDRGLTPRSGRSSSIRKVFECLNRAVIKVRRHNHGTASSSTKHDLDRHRLRGGTLARSTTPDFQSRCGCRPRMRSTTIKIRQVITPAPSNARVGESMIHKGRGRSMGPSSFLNHMNVRTKQPIAREVLGAPPRPGLRPGQTEGAESASAGATESPGRRLTRREHQAFRWQRGQKCEPRFMNSMRRIRVPHRGHGSPARPYAFNECAK